MGNECPECETPIPDCKARDVLKQQPKNRSDLDLSSIKKGEYKKISRKLQYQDSDVSQIPELMVESVVIQKGSKKVQFSTKKKQKGDSSLSVIDTIKKPLSLEPETQTVDIKKGVKYIGGTIDGQPHEKGKIVWEDGTTMLGQFFLGQMAENEKIYLKVHNGVTYEGQMFEGKAYNRGKLILPDGSSYDGEWKDDLPDGYGKHKMSDGSFYQGQFSKGVKFGKGKFYFDSGMYDGKFANDQFQGEGTMVLNDGKTIRGSWKNGVLQGKGEIEWNTGQKYVGSLSRNCREGEGTYFFADGRQWRGEWTNDLQNGFGHYQLPSGETVKGIWVQGVKKDQMREVQSSRVQPI